MTWVKVRAHRKLSLQGVAIALRQIAKSPRLKLVITLGPDVLERTGWKAGQEVEFWRGDADHAGSVRLVPGRQEAYRLRWFGTKGKNQDKLSLAVWAWDALPSERQRVTQCEWKVVQANGPAVIEIALPSWARGGPAAAFDPVSVGIVDVVRWCNENEIPVVPRNGRYSINGQKAVDAAAVLARANAQRARCELPPFALVST